MTISLKVIVNIAIVAIVLHVLAGSFFRYSVNRSLSKIERSLFDVSEQIQKLQDKVEESYSKNKQKTILPYFQR